MLRRYELTDEEWNRIAPLLPLENSGKQGRPQKCSRTILNGIVWIARSGAPWWDLPERYGSCQTVYSHFRKWIEDGTLDNIFRVLSLEAELTELSIDASIVKAHQHSAGAKKVGHQTKSDTAVVEPAQKSMQLYMHTVIRFILWSVKGSVMISITQSLCWIMSIPMEVMYWQIVDTTVTI